MGTIGAIFTSAEAKFYETMSKVSDFDEHGPAQETSATVWSEAALIGAGVGGGFSKTQELRPMKYNEAMASEDKDGWEKSVKEEYQRFEKYKVFKAVSRDEVPKGSKFVTTTWAMKKKSNGTLRARLNMRGYEQKDGVHFDSSSIASPVTSDVTVRVCLVLMIMAGWVAQLVDVKGAFLHGEFDK